MAQRETDPLQEGHMSLMDLLRRTHLIEQLRYFEDVLPIELKAVNKRRARNKRLPVQPIEPKKSGTQIERPPPDRETARKLSPDPRKLFLPDGGGPPGGGFHGGQLPADPDNPDYDKTRPRPVPCTATGLAFSGGGIRSAAVCLGALQALHRNGRIEAIDYISTVSGGGYIGSCLSAAMSSAGGRTFPFGDDISDSAAVAHLRNYSNYLLPRGRSAVRNISDVSVVILRGLLANIVLVLGTLISLALITQWLFPKFLSQCLVARMSGNCFSGYSLTKIFPFNTALWLLIALVVVLLAWAVLRSFTRFDDFTGDTNSRSLTLSRWLLIATLVATFLFIQPFAIEFLNDWPLKSHPKDPFHWLSSVLVAFCGVISALSSRLGEFLKVSEHDSKWRTFLLRGLTRVAIFLAAMILPVGLWIAYLYLSILVIDGSAVANPFGFASAQLRGIYLVVIFVFLLATASLSANGYSLHRLYRDRLSKAFLFDPRFRTGVEPKPLDSLKLSALTNTDGPYHIVNTAMNVQGSAEANRRGRNADFFMFTRDFVGSDLTFFAPTNAKTTDMEAFDPRLDLATAMAISGASISANMGSSTIRLLSPTLALLNVRLGYWMRNPRDLAMKSSPWDHVRAIPSRLFGKFYLLLEMFNLLDETSRNIYLSDGGHIENLGVYELLKRGCELIVVVDAEADPSLSFGSLLKVERYARIDLGVRIELPWEKIANQTKYVSKKLAEDGYASRSRGPHCAVGRILYENGAQGIIVYFKSSFTGDETDYVLDYKKRYPTFPHETTGDQFFSEEQFEVYRSLGFHMIDGFFSGSDRFSYLESGANAFADRKSAFAAVAASLPAMA
jgi:hypothetical protein